MNARESRTSAVLAVSSLMSYELSSRRVVMLCLVDSCASWSRNTPSHVFLVGKNTSVECVEWLELSMLLEQYPALKKPRKPCSGLIFDELSSRDSEDIVQLFQCALL